MRESKVTLQSMTMSVFNSYGDSLVEIVCRDAFDSTNIIQVSNIHYFIHISDIHNKQLLGINCIYYV